MRRRLLFFILHPLLAFSPCMALESRISGDWTDFTTFDHKVEFKADPLPFANDVFSMRGIYIDRRSSVKPEKSLAGLELLVPDNESFYIGAGPLRFSGLPYSLSNPFEKSLHTGSRYRPTTFTLDTGATATKSPELVVSFGTSRRKSPWVRTAAIIDSTENSSFFLGIGTGQKDSYDVRIEAFAGEALIPERKCDTWFSEEPPLPERKQQLSAMALTTTFADSQWFFCGALSQTETQGSGIYLKTTGDVEYGPFRVIMGTDAATPHFIDGSGDATSLQLRTLADLRYAHRSLGSISLRGVRISSGLYENARSIDFQAGLRRPYRRLGNSVRLIEVSGELERTRPTEDDGLNLFKAKTRLGFGWIYTKFETSLLVNNAAIREETGVSAQTTIPFGDTHFSVSAGTVMNEKGQPKWSLALGVAMSFMGGMIQVDFGTDAPKSWEILSGAAPSSSPLGPYTFSLSWRFRERFQPRPFSVE